MAISGSSFSSSASNALAAYSTNQLRQQEKTTSLGVNLNKDDSSNKKPAEFIFRGELLDEARENNGFRPKKAQTIDPANQTAINNYEDNNIPAETTFNQQQGSILDAYA